MPSCSLVRRPGHPHAIRRRFAPLLPWLFLPLPLGEGAVKGLVQYPDSSLTLTLSRQERSKEPNAEDSTRQWLGGARNLWRNYSAWYVAFGAAQVHAAEPTLLRASIAKSGPVLVGEHVTMIVELLTATTFASAPIFELPKESLEPY